MLPLLGGRGVIGLGICSGTPAGRKWSYTGPSWTMGQVNVFPVVKTCGAFTTASHVSCGTGTWVTSNKGRERKRGLRKF